MIIKLEENLQQEDIEILIKYAKMNQEVKRIISTVSAIDHKIGCHLDHQEIWINASDIYYVESVDKRTFVYGEKEVYRTGFRLYELEEKLSSIGFVKISKSCLMNINLMKSLRSLGNSRMEVTMENGECINITRRYVKEIKLKLMER